MKEKLKQFTLYIAKLTGFVFLTNYLRINLALGRGALVAPLRVIDLTNPATWEFSAFSQNGEDGIIDVLSRKIKSPNNYFIEIGSYDGIDCNTAYLAIARKYCGLMIEGSKYHAAVCRRMMPYINMGCECVNMFVTKKSVVNLLEIAQTKFPDIMSIDIDGNDYYIAKTILEAGFSPKIVVVEYNSVYGPTNKLTTPYKADFNYLQESDTRLYFGVAIATWKQLFRSYGYQFITVESRGVNAFFAHPDYFPESFLSKVKGESFQENFNHQRKWKVNWQKQFEKIKHLDFYRP